MAKILFREDDEAIGERLYFERGGLKAINSLAFQRVIGFLSVRRAHFASSVDAFKSVSRSHKRRNRLFQKTLFDCRKLKIYRQTLQNGNFDPKVRCTFTIRLFIFSFLQLIEISRKKSIHMFEANLIPIRTAYSIRLHTLSKNTR